MRRFPIIIIIVVFLLSWVVLQSLISLYPTFLWFDNLQFASVFWINLYAKVLTGVAFGLLFLVIAGLNVFAALKFGHGVRRERRGAGPDVRRFIQQLFGEEGGQGQEQEEDVINITPQPALERGIRWFWIIGIVILSIFMGFSAVPQWHVILKALNATPFGISDPIFGRDIGFYIFNFPLQKFVEGFVFSSLVLSLLAVIWIYVINGAIQLSGIKITFSKGVKAHLALLFAILTLVFAWRLWLGELEILYSARGVVFGAGYTDVKAQLVAYNLQIIVLFVLAALFLINIFQKDYKLPAAGIGAYLVVALIMGGIFPAIIQNLQVKPSEISLEAPYIAYGIKYTRLAYGLDKIEEREFAANQSLTLKDLEKNSQTIRNIRLWDSRPLIKSYRQIQGIRLYYDFSDVDVDRYHINGNYQEVMLSPRELKVDKLPQKAQTWVNRHLKFTHGFGLCLSPVNEQTPEGLPDLIIKDIPPTTKTNLKIDRPEIYYGEETDEYVIVKTKEEEFDYPKGDKNVYATYQGSGGVEISSMLRRLAFTVKYADLKILLTNYITPKSRILFDRSIRTRVSKIAPYLNYDRDPYMVISKGKLYWIQDAYTTSNLFPYSDPSGSGFNRFNYIRNSIKVVIDAYNGTVTYYLIDEKDPIARTYQKIYPDLYKPFSQMPEDLKEHLRYPYDLFMVQAYKYATFHMEDPQVFYNQEDLWNVPNEVYEGSEQTMDGYYIIMKLPTEKGEEFLLMLPFTPNNKDNMISWLAARSDMPNYGKLLVYKFPKDKLIYGPMQIEARIDQQTEISQQFTLWGQVGSRVIRGNLLAIPIEQSIIYVEPIYLEAATGELPELKRVITVYGKNVAMEETLDSALSSVFAGRVAPAQVAVEAAGMMSPRELAKKALDLFNRMQASLKEGNFGGFGQRLKELQNILQDLAK